MFKIAKILILPLFLLFLGITLNNFWRSRSDDRRSGVVYADASATPGQYFIDNFIEEMTSDRIKSNFEDRDLRLPCSFCFFFKDGKFFSAQDKESRLWSPNGSVLWRRNVRVHHDISISEDQKNISMVVGYVSGKKRNGKKIRENGVEVLDINGDLKFQWNFNDHIAEFEKIFGSKISWKNDGYFSEISHLNSAQELPHNPFATKDPRFQAGNILTNDFWNQVVFIVDRKTKKIVWSMGDVKNPIYLHSVRMLKDGNIIAYQNIPIGKMANGSKRSSLIWIDPISKQVLRELPLLNDRIMESDIWGSLQILSDDRFLVTISKMGEAFEINSKGKIFWHWKNPVLENNKSKPVYRVYQIPNESFFRNIGWSQGLY